VEALGKMSIETTYKGMWSSDTSLLKSLLDAGETIVAVHKAADNVTKLSFSRNEYWACNDDGIYPISEKLDCWSFLIPPRQLVLEPKPLRWSMWDAFSSNLKARDEWRTSVGTLASGRIRYTVESRDGKHYWRIFNEGDYGSHAHGYCDTQEEAIKKIEKWRKDHLEMPVFKCESDPIVEPKPLEWKQDIDNEKCESAKGGEDWRFYASIEGHGRIYFRHEVIFSENSASMDTAKAAIHEWRVNHLKSMLP